MYLLYPMCICIYIHTYMSLHRMLKMMYFLAISVRLVRRKEEGGKKKRKKDYKMLTSQRVLVMQIKSGCSP